MITVFDELWGYNLRARASIVGRMIPVPTRKVSCRLVVTSLEGESELLHELYGVACSAQCR